MTEKIEWYKEVLELEPNSKVFFPLAKMLAQEGEKEEAIKTLEKGLERYPEYLEARLFLIELLFSSRHKDACSLQIRRLSAMFASYAGFWQAWAACLAEEPAEEDTASILRFLAANFISGPLKLHDVINKGLKAILAENNQQPEIESLKKDSLLSAADMPGAENASFTESGNVAESNVEETEETVADMQETALAPDGVFEAAVEEQPLMAELEGGGLPEETGPDFEENAELLAGEAIPESGVEDIEDADLVPEAAFAEAQPVSQSEEVVFEPEQDAADIESVIDANMEDAEDVIVSPPVEENAAASAESLASGESLAEEQNMAAELDAEDALEEDLIMEDARQQPLKEDIEEAALSVNIDDAIDLEELDSEIFNEDAAVAPESLQPAAIPSLEENVADILQNALDEDSALLKTETLDNVDIPDVPDLMDEDSILPDDEPVSQGKSLESEDDVFNDLIDSIALQADALESANAEKLAEQAEVAEIEPAAENNKMNFADEAEDSLVIEAGMNGNAGQEAVAEPPSANAPELLTSKLNYLQAAAQEERISLRTRSMAEVLAEQGDIKGALDIYHELAASAANSQELDDISKRISTLEHMGSATQETEESDRQDSKKLIGLLEALAKRVEARVAN